MKLFEWTNMDGSSWRLGQQHWSIPNSGETLCGKPMLGNNYSKILGTEDKEPCAKCLAKEQELRGTAI